MPTIMDQTTSDPATLPAAEPVSLPTVTYNPVDRTVSATVVTSWDPIVGLIIQAPIIAIPKGGESLFWTVLWTIQRDNTLQAASFNSSSDGVEVPTHGTTMPPGVGLLTSGPVEQALDKWKITIDNRAEAASPFNYTLSIAGTPTSFVPDVTTGKPQRMLRKYDPTIVVTLDPMT